MHGPTSPPLRGGKLSHLPCPPKASSEIHAAAGGGGGFDPQPQAPPLKHTHTHTPQLTPPTLPLPLGIDEELPPPQRSLWEKKTTVAKKPDESAHVHGASAAFTSGMIGAVVLRNSGLAVMAASRLRRLTVMKEPPSSLIRRFAGPSMRRDRDVQPVCSTRDHAAAIHKEVHCARPVLQKSAGKTQARASTSETHTDEGLIICSRRGYITRPFTRYRQVNMLQPIITPILRQHF